MAKKTKDTTTTKTPDVSAMLSSFSKKYGKMVQKTAPEIEYWGTTGSLCLDICLGGGLPKGKVMQISGKEQSGKTLLCLLMAAEVHKRGGNVLYIDAEYRFDALWARKNGVKTDDDLMFTVLRPETGEDAMNAALELIKTGHYQLVIFDSIATARPSSELDKGVEEHNVGRHSTIVSKFVYQVGIACGATDTTLVCINQIRAAIGVMFGPSTDVTGGNALKFALLYHVSMLSPKIELDDEDAPLSMTTRFKMAKSARSILSKGECTINLKSGGLNKEAELLELGESFEILEKKGSWYWLGEQRLENGKDKSCVFLQENPDISTQIRDLIMTEVNEKLAA